MKWLLIVVAVVVLVGIIAIGSLVGGYNNLVQLDTQVDNSWAQVENQLQRRNDLVPNLVETVKGITEQEREVFGAIADARARMAGAKSQQEVMGAARMMDGALGRLFVVVENYPQLRSSENFMRLQDELAGTENRIATERRRYNESVRSYNATIRTFPTMLYAGAFGFEGREFFEATEGAEQVPEVRFTEEGGEEG
jgi:LemA protein